MLVLAAVIVAAAVGSQSWWALFFLVPLMFGGVGFRRGWEYSGSGEDDPRYQRHMARLRYRQERLAARYGYQPSRPDGGDSPSGQPRLPDQAAAGTLPGVATPATSTSVPAPRPQSAAGQFAGGTQLPPPANPAG